MGKILLGCALLGAALYLFLFSAMATASDGQGAVLFLFTVPVMAAALAFAVLLAGKTAPLLARVAKGGLIFLGIFLVCVFLPGLNLLPAAVVGAVAGGYRLLYGETPYEAHHHQEDVLGMLEKSLEAQGGNTLDLRGFHLARDWRRVCLFGPYTTDEAAWKAGLPADWPLSTYSRIAVDDGHTALVLVGEKYPVRVVDLPRSKMDFAPAAVARCFEREEAVFQRGGDGKFSR
jgi:hypothetical protein